MRILTKEKDSLSDKLMEQKLEVLKLKNDIGGGSGGHSTFREIRRQMDLIPTVLEENEDEVNL